MQQLEGFKFVTALDLNTEYYTIRLYAKSKDITNIVTEFGKIPIKFPPNVNGYVWRYFPG